MNKLVENILEMKDFEIAEKLTNNIIFDEVDCKMFGEACYLYENEYNGIIYNNRKDGLLEIVVQLIRKMFQKNPYNYKIHLKNFILKNM